MPGTVLFGQSPQSPLRNNAPKARVSTKTQGSKSNTEAKQPSKKRGGRGRSSGATKYYYKLIGSIGRVTRSATQGTILQYPV